MENQITERSSWIPLSEARVMHTYYLENSPLLVVLPNEAVPQPLKGLWFDRDDIMSIFNRADGKNVTHLFLAFGKTEDGNTQIMACGIEDGNLPDNGSILTDQIYDMCDPCPNVCPSNISILQL